MSEGIDKKTIRREIQLFLRRLGLFPHLSGYNYLVDAIDLVIENPSLIKSVTTELYPIIAQKNGYDNYGPIDRSIRHAISLSINNPEMLLLFQGATGKPSNSMFIATVAEEIKFKLDI